jgi:hypothetical protein
MIGTGDELQQFQQHFKKLSRRTAFAGPIAHGDSD